MAAHASRIPNPESRLSDPFAQRLLAWFDTHGRKNLPWQHPRTPYRVWLSEVMLQQTQVRMVVGYFDRFVDALPTLDALAALPGIGRSTAAAILAQAHGERHAILDGNVKRVLARWHGIDGWPGTTTTARRLWAHADAHTPATRVADYTQAIMDLGATVCVRVRPRCD
ncbi:MAG: A/G-specific adenine glycosylase, partial [Rhodanobacteraceae bacterium]